MQLLGLLGLLGLLLVVGRAIQSHPERRGRLGIVKAETGRMC